MKLKQERISVIDLMIQDAATAEDYPPHRRCAANARLAIIEKRVSLNGRLVTHTDTQVVRGPLYHISVHSLNTGTSDNWVAQ